MVAGVLGHGGRSDATGSNETGLGKLDRADARPRCRYAGPSELGGGRKPHLLRPRVGPAQRRICDFPTRRRAPPAAGRRAVPARAAGRQSDRDHARPVGALSPVPAVARFRKAAITPGFGGRGRTGTCRSYGASVSRWPRSPVPRHSGLPAGWTATLVRNRPGHASQPALEHPGCAGRLRSGRVARQQFRLTRQCRSTCKPRSPHP